MDAEDRARMALQAPAAAKENICSNAAGAGIYLQNSSAALKKMRSLFVRLINPIPITDPVEISSDELSLARELAIKHKVFPLVYSRIQSRRNFFYPARVVDEFLGQNRNLYLKGVALSAKMEGLEKEVSSLLASEGIPSVVIRGNAIAEELYGDPNSRTSSDIDILIKISDALHADQLLSDAGFHRNDNIPLKFWFYRIHHAVYHCPRTDNLIEIHWNFGIPSFFRLSSEEIWEGVITADSSRLRLSPEMSMLMLLIHHHMHSFRELKILADIIWSFHKYEDNIDWDSFYRKLSKAGLIKTALITISQIRSVWDEDIHDLKGLDLLYHKLQKNHRAGHILKSFFEMDLNKEYRFQHARDTLMARFALDGLSTIIRSYSKMLFPSPAVIKELYENKASWSLPMNYLKFIRWRVKSWRNTHTSEV